VKGKAFFLNDWATLERKQLNVCALEWKLPGDDSMKGIKFEDLLLEPFGMISLMWFRNFWWFHFFLIQKLTERKGGIQYTTIIHDSILFIQILWT